MKLQQSFRGWTNEIKYLMCDNIYGPTFTVTKVKYSN